MWKRKQKYVENYVLVKRNAKEKAFFTLFGVFAVAYAISVLFPLLWLVMSSLKDSMEYAQDLQNLDPFKLPTVYKWSNYIEVFSLLKYKNTNYLGMIFNSIWQIFFSVTTQLFCVSLFGYVMAKYSFKGKEFLYGMAIFILTIPIVGNGGAYFVLINELGLYDNPIQVIAVNLYCFGGNFLVTYACFKNISWDYAEAVFIDGGGHWTVYFKIMLPMAMPVLSTLMITSSIAQWNEYMGVMLYYPSFPNVAAGLYLTSMTINRSGGPTLYFTGLVISIIPVALLFLIFSDKLMKNLTVGGLKG